MEKNKRIKAEVTKLRKRFSHLSEDRKSLAYKTIDEVAYLGVTLEELQNIVNEEGVILVSINGNGLTTKVEHPAMRIYNKTIKNYISSLKQLNLLLPDSKAEGVERAGEMLKAFIEKGKK